MINTQQNLDNILQYRPMWSESDKTKYMDNLNIINNNYDKLLNIHKELIENSINKFEYLTDMVAEFITTYLRGKK